MQPPFAVVFDTNAYRNLVYGLSQADADARVRALNDAEVAKGIEAFASPFVLVELFARLADKSDSGYKDLRNAARATWRHCALDVRGSPMLATLADFESQLAETICHTELPDHRQLSDVLTSAAKRVGEAADTDPMDDLTAALQAIQLGADQIRDRFVADLKDNVVLGVNPAATDLAPLARDAKKRGEAQAFVDSPDAIEMLARALIVKAHLLAGAPLPSSIPAQTVADAVSAFRVPLEMYNHIVRRITGRDGSNMEKRKRANAVWDFSISFAVGKDQRVNGLPVVLITDDGGIHEAARRAGYGDHVMDLSTYLGLLGVPSLGVVVMSGR